MYSKCKISIKLDEGTTSCFNTNIGVKQGCVISPTLFNLFLNDVVDIFDKSISDPVTLHDKELNCIMYADDIAIISKSPKGMQHCLDKFSEFCKSWFLNVNISKTNMMVCNKAGRLNEKCIFEINGEKLSSVKETKYLGVVFSNNGSFRTASEDLADKARKAFLNCISHLVTIHPELKPYCPFLMQLYNLFRYMDQKFGEQIQST